MLKKLLTSLGVITLCSGVEIKTVEASAKDIECLAKIIYHEARGEPKIGRTVIGMVTLNRVKHKKFPNSVCSVMRQPGQYSWVKNHPSVRDQKTYTKIKSEAKTLYDNYLKKSVVPNRLSPYKNALFFRSNGSFGNLGMKYIGQIGDHKFWGLRKDV